MSSRPVETARTVLFSSCFGLVEKNVLDTTVKILRRIDPDIKVLGGYDFCCGELHYIAGRPQEAQVQFSRLIQALEAFSPEKVVIFCPTCNMNFDERHRDSGWSHIFIMDYIADQLSRLGPLDRVDAAVTIHDPCHFVRGSRPGSDAPRKILRSIPGIRIAEMENARENSLCCGAYAITGTGASGMRFRDARLRQAENTGAGILSVYCPGCQMILGGPGPKLSLRVESILTLLGRSLGLV
jgi:Fe-S oxidoreductase